MVATLNITVTHGVASSIVLATVDGITTMVSGAQKALKVTAKDAANNAWDVTGEVTFTENDPIGTIVGSVYTAGAVGIWELKATL